MKITDLTVEQRIQRAHIQLMSHKKFCLFSGIFMLGNTSVVDDDKVTAYTNGKDTKYGRNFVTPLSSKQLNFLILHENMHKAFRHLKIWKHLYKKNPKLANVACDHVINLMIQDYDPNNEVSSMPPGGCADPRFRGMDSGQVFKILEEDAKNGKGSGEGEGGFDDHDWEGAEELTEAQAKELERKIDEALRQGVIMQKKRSADGTGGDRLIDGLLNPKINPYDLLREYMVSVCNNREDSTWRKPNRRFLSQDLYMPSNYAPAMGRILIGVDTSGSIGGTELQEFLTETAHICNSVMPEGVDLVYWDTEVCAHEEYTRDDLAHLPDSTKPAGGGGTDVQSIREWFKGRNNVTPEVAIIFTDGYVGDVGAWHDMPPTVWVVNQYGDRNFRGPGQTIHL
jgi:predicted metal-dependent peptidase